MILLCKYYIVISDTLVDSFLDEPFLSLAVILSELHKKPRRKDWVSKKVCRRTYVRDITFLTTRSLFYVFLLLSLSSPFPFPSDILAAWEHGQSLSLFLSFSLSLSLSLSLYIYIYIYIYINGWKYENLLQFNTTRFFFYKQCFFQFNFRVA